MKEVVEGTNVFWYPSQRALCSTTSNWKDYANMAIDIFFDKVVLAISCARGQKKGKKRADTVALNTVVVDAIVGELYYYTKRKVTELERKYLAVCSTSTRG
jgi:hypothetical protein